MNKKISTAVNLDHLLQQALQLHRDGKILDAKHAYATFLQRYPQHADALHLAGVLELQTQHHMQAIKLISRAIKIAPQHASFYVSRGNALRNLNKLREAVDDYNTAIRIDPTFPVVYNNRANLLKKLGQVDAALADYQEALRLRFDYADAYYNRANTLHNLGRLQEAFDDYSQAIRYKENNIAAYNNRGNVLRDMRRIEEAIQDYNLALAIDNNFVTAYKNRAHMYLALNRFDEAYTDLTRCIDLEPQAETYYQRANMLQARNQLEAALVDYNSAIALDKTHIASYNNRASVLLRMNRINSALADMDASIALSPNDATYRWNKALILLTQGRFKEGWENYEWRWEGCPPMQNTRPSYDKPLWLGETPIEGKTILVYAEQGIGDVLQFCRYLPRLKAKGARVLLAVQPSLLKLMSTLDGVDTLLTQGDALPIFDFHIPVMSLPLAFKTFSMVDIPSSDAYLFATQDSIAIWQARLGTKIKPRVGLVWNGGLIEHLPEQWLVNTRRNITFASIAKLNRSDIDFYSLQKGEPAESELLHSKEQYWPSSNLHIYSQDLCDFNDTAGLITQLDLVISVDTSVAHLAAAMGKPVWLLNRFDTDWRWLLGRDDSPWYPTLRQFRQKQDGDWEDTIARVTLALGQAFN